MRDLASAMSSSSELCFRRALTDIPTRVDCKASGQSQRWQGSVPEADPHQGLLAPTVNSWGMGRDRKPRAPTYHLPDHQRESEILSLEQLFVPIKPHGSLYWELYMGVYTARCTWNCCLWNHPRAGQEELTWSKCNVIGIFFSSRSKSMAPS